MIKKWLIVPGFALAISSGAAQAVPVAADVVLLVDESGSMGGEHAWIPGMVSDLEAALTAAGVGAGADPNRYAVVGFGAIPHDAPGGLTEEPHKHPQAGPDWFGAGDIGTAAGELVTFGGTEDGWAAIDFFFGNYTPRANAALNLILITDEDRDVTDPALNYADVLGALTGANALLNVVVDCNFADGSGSTAIGVAADGTAYLEDGTGGFLVSAGGTQSGNCYGTTVADYVDLAWDTGGAAWDLNILRAGGDSAASFTAAFVDLKVTEITSQPPTGQVPAPATLALVGLGLLGVGMGRRRRR